MARRKDRADLIPDMRGGYKRALKIMEESGRPLSTIILEMIEQDPFKAFDLLIKLHPKEMQLAIDQTVTINANEVTPDLMREAILARRSASLPSPGADAEVH